MSGLILRLEGWDRRLLNAMVGRRRPLLNRWMWTATRLGDPPMAIATGLALALGLLGLPAGVGREALLILALSHGFVQLLKRRISRPRPSLPVGFGWLDEPPDRFSFPSGHAAAGLSLALPVALALPSPMGVVVLATGLAVGLSRSYLGVHYPGDVVAGWSLAALSDVLVRLMG